ncbi:MAG TPA: glycosyltransferase, partial [Gaiellaceae bacterium]|nr:glycosyltransferase [Gaiellaceae bacterium]
MARLLPAAGFQPLTVLLEDGPLREWLERNGSETQVLPAGRFRQVGRTARTIAHLRRLARELEPAIVLSSAAKGHLYGGSAVLGLHVPEVWMQHGVPERTSAQERLAALVPTARIACYASSAIAAQKRITPRTAVVKIPGGVPVEQIGGRRGSGAEIRRELGWEDNPIVGIVARLQPWKGQETFLRAAALLHARRPEIRYAVVGGAILGWEGDYPDRLEQLAADLRIANVVHFAGHQDDVYPWYDALDVAVHASFGEPFGLALLEAMAIGTPLVAAADGGPLEIV